MPATKTAPKKPAAKAVKAAKAAKSSRAAAKSVAKPPASAKPKSPAPALSEVMREMEKAGSAQTRKTYARHGAPEPMFGVSFATLKTLVKRIGVNQALALELWETGNFDARNLAVKIADPAGISPSDLDRWAGAEGVPRMCGGYVAMLAAEGPHAAAKLKKWLGGTNVAQRASGWALLGQVAYHDESIPDAFFVERIGEIERGIHTAPNAEREPMNLALIMIGCRNAALRKSATAAAKRIGKVDIDYGDTACKTPDAAAYIDKTWDYAKSKGFDTPAAQERAREPQRLRC